MFVYADALDLLTRMNTEATRQAWVTMPSAGQSITVFNIERSKEGLYQQPKVAFAVPASAFPANSTAASVREWLAKQAPVKAGTVPASQGAVIRWRQVE